MFKVITIGKAIITVWLWSITLLTSTTSASYAFELFSAENYSEVAALPGSSLGAPSGMVSSWGTYFVALGGLTNSPGSDRTDGSFSMGMGLGDSINSIGATVTLGIGSVNPDGGAAERGAFNVAIGKFFTDWQLGVAIGGANVAGWNTITTKPKSSAYLAVTKIIPIEDHPVIVNAGFGTNAFADINALVPEDESAGFIAVGVYLSPQISLIIDHTSGILSLGTSMSPIADLPFVMTLGAFDVNKAVPNHKKISFTGSIAYSFSF